MKRQTPSYQGLRPISERASAAARGASRKAKNRCEMALRRALWSAGCRFRTDVRDLPGRPDIVFSKARLVIFCDGDFWHGKDWGERATRLGRGHNSEYWLAKIQRNIERDRQRNERLRNDGWTVLRFWESFWSVFLQARVVPTGPPTANG